MTDEEQGEQQQKALAAARTLGDAQRLAVLWLRATDASPTPDLDAQVLLAHVIAVPRATLLAFPERALVPADADRYARLIARRVAREPVAHLTGHREFMGLDFLTDARALIPRPETELLVEAALAEIRARLAGAETQTAPPVVADVGTGSGAIAVSIAALEPRLPHVYATDLSADALALAGENARHLGVADRVTLLQGDLLGPLPAPVDLLLANLPYVAPRDASQLPTDVARYEPALALYGHADGLGHFRRLFTDAPAHLRPGAVLMLEFGYDQRAAIESLARTAFPQSTVRVGADYAGWDRYVIVRVEESPGRGV
jgi:release factor glutamine methyltransferase